MGVDGSLDPQVAEHGVGLPAPEELDGIGIDASTEEGGSAAGAKRAGADQFGVDAGRLMEGLGRNAEGLRNLGGSDGVPALVCWMGVVVTMDGFVGRSVVAAQVSG